MERYDIVFIDDESTLTEIFGHFIRVKHPGWRFATFCDSQKAYEQIVNKRISATVWIVDMMMPVKNGAQIAEAIRSATNGEGTVVLGYSALDRIEIKHNEALKRGLPYFDWLMTKHYRLSDLLSLAEACITQPMPVGWAVRSYQPAQVYA